MCNNYGKKRPMPEICGDCPYLKECFLSWKAGTFESQYVCVKDRMTGRLSEHGDPKRIAAVQKDGDDSAIAEAYRRGFADGFKKARGNKQ